MIEITYERRQRSKKDYFPEDLPREVQVIDVPDAERLCACCGDQMPIVATDVRERPEYISARMIVHELHYPNRACGKCKTGVTVASPQQSDQDSATLTAGSCCGFGVTSQIILGKYADQLSPKRIGIDSPGVQSVARLAGSKITSHERDCRGCSLCTQPMAADTGIYQERYLADRQRRY